MSLWHWYDQRFNRTSNSNNMIPIFILLPLNKFIFSTHSSFKTKGKEEKSYCWGVKEMRFQNPLSCYWCPTGEKDKLFSITIYLIHYLHPTIRKISNFFHGKHFLVELCDFLRLQHDYFWINKRIKENNFPNEIVRQQSCHLTMIVVIEYNGLSLLRYVK